MHKGLTIVVLLAAVALGLWLVLDDSGSEPNAPDSASDGVIDEEPAEGPVLERSGAGPSAAPRIGSGRFTIRGSVLDADKQPLPGVRVELLRTVQRWPGSGYAATLAFNVVRIRDRARALLSGRDDTLEPVGELVSDERGQFVFRLEEGGWYHLYARVEPPAAGSKASAYLIAEAKENQDVTLRVLAGTPVRGRVENARGEAVSARVGVWRGRWRGEADSGASGEFEFAAVPAGKAWFSVTLPTGRQISGYAVEIPAEQSVVLRVPGGTASLSGTVRAPDGTGVAGASIVLHLILPLTEGSEKKVRCELAGETDANGLYAFEGLPAGAVRRLEAAAAGFLAESRHAGQGGWDAVALSEDESITIDVTLRRGSVVHGRVTRKGDGAPLEGATVKLIQMAGVPPPQIVRTTDAAGRYRFEGIDAGNFIVLASHPTHFNPELEAGIAAGFGSGTREPPASLAVRLQKEDQEVEREVVLVSGRRITGTVVDPDGRPVADARVYVKSYGLGSAGYRWGLMMSADVPPVTTSSEDGSFVIDGLAPRTDWVLFARRLRFAATDSEPVDLSSAASAQVTLRLAPECVLKGHVYDAAGQPLPDQSITISGYTTLRGGDWRFKSGADGAFELHSLPAARLDIATSRGSESVEMRVADLKPGEVRTGLELRYGSKGEISGTVTDSRGEPVRGVTLVVSRMTPVHSQAMLIGSSGKDGRFRIQNVLAGRVRLSLYRHGVGRGKFLTEPFDAPATDVTVKYDPPREVTIEGVVVGPDGGPVPSCSLTVHSSENQGTASREVTGGAFKIKVKGEPPYRVSASNPRDSDGARLNYRPVHTQITDASEQVTLRLEAGTIVSGRVLDADGKGVAGVGVQAASGSDIRTDIDGAWSLVGLPDELVGLTFRPPAVYLVPEPVVVEPGTNDIVTRLLKGTYVRGRVIVPEDVKFLGGSVQVRWATQGKVGSGSRGGTLKASGLFLVQGLPPDVRVSLEVTPYQDQGASPRLAPASVSNVPTGGEDVEITLRVGIAVSGTVFNADGSAFSGGTVFLRGEGEGNGWSPIDADGGFRAEGLRPGAYKLRVSDQEGHTLTNPQDVTAPATGVRVVLPSMGSISGRLVGAEDASAWGVTALDPKTGEIGAGDSSVGVDADGTWTLGPLEEGRAWVLMARDKLGVSALYARSAPVQVGATDVKLTVQEGEAIGGRTERTGRALPRCWVSAQGPGWQAGVLSDKDGVFTLNGLPPGRYRLNAQEWSLDIKAAREGVATGSTGVVLTLE